MCDPLRGAQHEQRCAAHQRLRQPRRDDARRTQTPTAPAGPDAVAAPTNGADAAERSASLIRLGTERLAQVHVAAQPYTGLAGIARDTACGRRRPLRDESLLEADCRPETPSSPSPSARSMPVPVVLAGTRYKRPSRPPRSCGGRPRARSPASSRDGPAPRTCRAESPPRPDSSGRWSVGAPRPASLATDDGFARPPASARVKPDRAGAGMLGRPVRRRSAAEYSRRVQGCPG